MKNAIVTGGTRGIGFAIATMLIEEGYSVTVTYAHDDESADRCRQKLSPYQDRLEIVKAAIIALAENMVKQFEGSGTTVNAIAPGFVDTEWQNNKEAEHRRRICEKIALGRFADPSEIAEAVRFCVRSAYVNGSVIQVSGGYSYK